MKSNRLSRRRFLAQSVGWSAPLMLGACSSLDRIIMGEARDESERVVILGAGLSGLMTAYQLKKSRIPYQIFEATHRAGGRVWSVPSGIRGVAPLELGGEWFSRRQEKLWALLQEMKVEVVEAKEQLQPLYRAGGRLSSLRRRMTELSKIHSNVYRSGRLDSRSLSEWIRGLTKDSETLQLVDQWSLDRYGVSSQLIRASAFADRWLEKGASPWAPWTEERFRMRNGSSALVQGLVDRLGSFRPDQNIRFEHALRSIRYRNGLFELGFETPSGTQAVVAHHVVCALPRAALLAIDGAREVGAEGLQTLGVGTGFHSKIVMAFNERFWSPSLNQNKIWQWSSQQTLTESSLQVNPLFQFRQGILSLQWAGEGSRSLGPHHIEALRKDLSTQFKKEVNPAETLSVNWGGMPWFQGSVSYPQVGVSLQSRPPESPQGWVWAGEHMGGAFVGTMEGALRAGESAAQQILRQRFQGSDRPWS